MALSQTDFTENVSLLVSQYRHKPNINALLRGFLTLGNDQYIHFLREFEKSLSVDYAKGRFLDRIGHNHGFKRPDFFSEDDWLKFQKAEDVTVYSNFRFPFYYGADSKLHPVSDLIYRKLLKIWIRSLFFDGSLLMLYNILTDNIERGCSIVEKTNERKIYIAIFDSNTIFFNLLCNLSVLPKVAGITYVCTLHIHDDKMLRATNPTMTI